MVTEHTVSADTIYALVMSAVRHDREAADRELVLRCAELLGASQRQVLMRDLLDRTDQSPSEAVRLTAERAFALPTEPAASQITLTSPELMSLVMPALEYAMGRRSYLVGWMCDILRAEARGMESEDVERIIAAISARSDDTLGDRHDIESWRNLQLELRAHARR